MVYFSALCLHDYNKNIKALFMLQHYNSIMKYMSKGPMLVDVHMHKPTSSARHFMDALLAFWPGLQVLKGDISPAIKTHEMLYQVIQRHNFLPEVILKLNIVLISKSRTSKKKSSNLEFIYAVIFNLSFIILFLVNFLSDIIVKKFSTN